MNAHHLALADDLSAASQRIADINPALAADLAAEAEAIRAEFGESKVVPFQEPPKPARPRPIDAALATLLHLDTPGRPTMRLDGPCAPRQHKARFALQLYLANIRETLVSTIWNKYKCRTASILQSNRSPTP